MRDGPERGRRAGRTSSRRGGKKTPAWWRANSARATEEERPRALQAQYNRDNGRQQSKQGGRYHLCTSNFRDSSAYLSDRRASRIVE
jgi:hypothetical protein